ADVAQQQLNDRARADELRAHRVLSPADAVHQRRRALAARVLRPLACDLEELVGPDAADPLDHLRRVAGVVALEDLVDATWVPQRRVGGDVPGTAAFVCRLV